MSNETMTDAELRQDLCNGVEANKHCDPLGEQKAEALRRAIARLRAEPEQPHYQPLLSQTDAPGSGREPEQQGQAVAGYVADFEPDDELPQTFYALRSGEMVPAGCTGFYLRPQPVAGMRAVELTVCCGREECGGECGNEWGGMQWVAIKDEAQPVAVAWDAVRALREIVGFEGDPRTPVHNAVRMRGIARAALSAAPAESRNDWREAVLDALANTGGDAPASEGPQEIIQRVIDFHTAIATDPAVGGAGDAVRVVPSEWIAAAQTINGIADLLSDSDEDGLAEKLTDALETLEAALSAAPAAMHFDDADELVSYLTDLWCDDAGVGVTWKPARIAADAIRAWQSGAPPVAGVPEGWRPISEASTGKLCVVAWNDLDDPDHPERHDFDYIEDGRWIRHDENVEHAESVAPPGSRIPQRNPPYQWFIELPPVLAAAPQPAAASEQVTASVARSLDEWHEDDGNVVWWKFPVDEPAWIGTPLCSDWPGYHTHWTAHPEIPSAAAPQPAACETCNGHGMIGGPSFYQPDEGGVPCPDCAPQPAAEREVRRG